MESFSGTAWKTVWIIITAHQCNIWISKREHLSMARVFFFCFMPGNYRDQLSEDRGGVPSGQDGRGLFPLQGNTVTSLVAIPVFPSLPPVPLKPMIAWSWRPSNSSADSAFSFGTVAMSPPALNTSLAVVYAGRYGNRAGPRGGVALGDALEPVMEGAAPLSFPGCRRIDRRIGGIEFESGVPAFFQPFCKWSGILRVALFSL